MTILGIIALALFVSAQYCLGRKWRMAFVLGIACESIWIWESWGMSRYDLLLYCVIYCGMATRNWWLWGKK